MAKEILEGRCIIALRHNQTETGAARFKQKIREK